MIQSPARILAGVVLCLSCFFCFALTGKVTDKTTQEIRALRDQWIKAEEAKDIPFLDNLLTDDAVVGNAQGQVLDKPHFLARMADPNRILKEVSAEDIQVRSYGETAILTERITIDGKDKGVAFGGLFRFIRIFVRQDGRWRVVLAQGTPIRPTPPNPE